MPLIKRAIDPEELSRKPLPTTIQNELECVANNTLSNVIRQLSSLSKHAEDMFQELSTETKTLFSRSILLQSRVERLQDKVHQLDATGEEVSLQDITLRKQFRSSQRADQQVVSRSSLPVAVVQRYQSCEPPPALNKLNVYRDDGRDSMKFFTDPGYFVELWIDETKKEQEQLKRRLKSKQRHGGPPVKKPENIHIKKKEYSQLAKGQEFVPDKKQVDDKRRRSREPVNKPQLDGGGIPINQYDASMAHNTHHQTPPTHHPSGYQHPLPASYQQQPARPHDLQQHYPTPHNDLRVSSADPPPPVVHEPSHYFTTEEAVRRRNSESPQQPHGMQRYHSVMRPAQPPPPVPIEQRQDLPPPPPASPPIASPPPPMMPEYTPSPPSPQQHYGEYHASPTSVSPPPPFMAGIDSGVSPANLSRDSMELPPPPTPPEIFAESPGIPTAPSPPPVLATAVAPPPLPNFTPPQATVTASLPPKTDARSELLAAIQQGAKLRRVEEQRNRVEQRRPTLGGIDVAAMMDRAVELRRKAISDSDSDSDENGEWDDE